MARGARVEEVGSSRPLGFPWPSRLFQSVPGAEVDNAQNVS
jgi:hypothetical protein